MIKIEVSRIHKFNTNGLCKAIVDIVIGESFVITGLKIVEGKEGLFVDMPQVKGKDGHWYNSVIPLYREVKIEVDRIVLESYNN
jgi:stage V sporulation protein G